MIEYDAGYWALSFFWDPRSWKASVIPKTMVWSIASSVCTFFLCYYLGPATQDGIRERNRQDVTVAVSAHSFVLGTLMVFRVNQAHSRYWECVTNVNQVRGKWFNAVSSLFAFCNSSEEKQEDVKKFQHTLVRLVSMLYCAALRQLEEKRVGLEILNNDGMDQDSLHFLDQANDQCEIILQWIQKLTIGASQAGTVNVAAPLLTRVYQELGQGMFDLNNVRKIRDVPFPFPYAQMITLMLLIHCCMTAGAAAFVFEQDYLAAMATFISVTSYVGVYYLTHEIERPFGDSLNSLPIADYLHDMNNSLRLLLEPRAQDPPSFDIDVSSEASVNVVVCRDRNFSELDGACPHFDLASQHSGSSVGSRKQRRSLEIQPRSQWQVSPQTKPAAPAVRPTDDRAPRRSLHAPRTSKGSAGVELASLISSGAQMTEVGSPSRRSLRSQDAAMGSIEAASPDPQQGRAQGARVAQEEPVGTGGAAELLAERAAQDPPDLRRGLLTSATMTHAAAVDPAVVDRQQSSW